MYHKNIKYQIRKQLKKQFPNWQRLSKKAKKELARQILTEVVAEYDFKQEINASMEEMLAIETQLPATVSPLFRFWLRQIITTATFYLFWLIWLRQWALI